MIPAIKNALKEKLRPGYYYSQALLRAPKIRAFDGRVHRRGALWDNGYATYPKLEGALLDQGRRLAEMPGVVIDEASIGLIAHLLSTVRDDVRAYIGPHARVDNISVSKVERGIGRESVSGSWHEDSVGHRLKLYFCVEGYGDVPTALLPGTNRKQYLPRLGDFYRFAGRDDFSAPENQVLLRHTTGSVTLFDTNGRHRGVYDKEHGPRVAMEIELVDRHKSNHFCCQTAIGPGNTGTVRFLIEKSIADARAEELLLDRALFKPHDATRYVYG